MAEQSRPTYNSLLLSWVLSTIEPWEDHRRTNFDDKWDEFYDIYRGRWSEQSKSRKSERSRLISPATQQAVESTAAEIEEAVLGKGAFFDVEDDYIDLASKESVDMRINRDLLVEDFHTAKVSEALSKIILMGCIYGTGIGKVNTRSKTVIEVKRDELSTGLTTTQRNRVIVELEPIHPKNFVIDPTARNPEESLGCAHIINLPPHIVYEKMRSGVYNTVDVRSGPSLDPRYTPKQPGELHVDDSNTIEVIEYHGKVPKKYLYGDGRARSRKNASYNEMEDELVEAIVIIANRIACLKKVESPFIHKDRSIVAYQHEMVPNRFHGRGVVEKGYNSQKALDAELRARIDGMAIAVNPMLGIDATRLPRGQTLSAHPGKVWLTNGPPGEAIFPFTMNGVNQATFHQSGELERYIQMGTGAMDSATSTTQNPRNSTASGMSMIQSSVIKRAKRTVRNISNDLLDPLVQKSAWRYMQFDPDRYPLTDYKFKVVTTAGLMAREYESAQLIQLLSIIPPDNPAFEHLLLSVVDNTNLPQRTKIVTALEESFKPDEEAIAAQKQAQQEAIQAARQREQLEQEEIKSKSIKNMADAESTITQVPIKQNEAETKRLSAILGALTNAYKADSPNNEAN